MRIRQWMGHRVESIEGLTQVARPRSEWPYAPDWIVDKISLDTAGRRYWIEGHHDDGRPFVWGAYIRPLDWRYDLTNAVMEVGRHETDNEALTREESERRVRLCPQPH